MEQKHFGRKPRTSWPPCKAAGCEKTAEGGSHGFCQTHYMAARRGRLDIASGAALRPMKRVRSYGEGARCLVSECGRRPKGRGLCTLHYQQAEDGKDLGVVRAPKSFVKTVYRPVAICLLPGCTNRPVNRWMCSKHAQQRDAGIIDEYGHSIRELMARGPQRHDGPTLDGKGYVLVVPPEGYIGPTREGRVLEHRLVMEQHLGRPLHGRDSEFYEVVHHKDGNVTNNTLSNLELRTQKTHPPGHEAPAEQLEVWLDALQHNDPAAYAALMSRRR